MKDHWKVLRDAVDWLFIEDVPIEFEEIVKKWNSTILPALEATEGKPTALEVFRRIDAFAPGEWNEDLANELDAIEKELGE